jgi:hypothetical protein
MVNENWCVFRSLTEDPLILLYICCLGQHVSLAPSSADLSLSVSLSTLKNKIAVVSDENPLVKPSVN